jgi:outer membrane protein TolC
MKKATMKKSAEKAQEKLVQEVDRGYDAVGTEESEVLFVEDLAQIQEKGGKETNTNLAQDKLIQGVDVGYDDVSTEERDLAQIQKGGVRKP